MASMESLPVGYIAALRIRGRATPDMPDNWTRCDGQKLKKKDYPELVAEVGDLPGSTKTLLRLPKLYSVDPKTDTVKIGYIKVKPEPELVP